MGEGSWAKKGFEESKARMPAFAAVSPKRAAATQETGKSTLELDPTCISNSLAYWSLEQGWTQTVIVSGHTSFGVQLFGRLSHGPSKAILETSRWNQCCVVAQMRLALSELTS